MTISKGYPEAPHRRTDNTKEKGYKDK